MAYTSITVAGVEIDETRWDWPVYRGAFAREVRVPLSVAQYVSLKQRIASRKGIVDIEIKCSGAPGPDAAAARRVIRGVRVLELARNNDLTCFLRMADARVDLSRYIAVSNIRIRHRDGFVDGTDVPDLEQALRLLCARAMHLFADNAFVAARGAKVPDGLLAAGAAQNRTLDWVLSQAGIDLWCSPRDGLLRFASREDIGASPLKKAHYWVRSRRPAWETESRSRFLLPRTLRYYYRRRHMLLVPIVSDTSTGSTTPLTVHAQQIYFDDGFSGTTRSSYLTADELFAKYGVARMTDARIAEAVMSQNFDGTPLQRDGSRDIDALIRIVKRDWRRLFRLVYPDRRGAWGGWTNLAVGLFARDENGRVTDDVLATGVRGDWVEFLNAVDGGGPDTILNQKVFTNHSGSPVLPTMPFSGTWESEDDGILRLNQQQLPDGNFAMPGQVRNIAEMTIKSVNVPIQLQGLQIASRWQFDVPTHDRARLSVSDMYLVIIATQRWPNNEGMFRVHEVPGFPSGSVPFQEFEVAELPALYDFTDAAARIDGEVHPTSGDGLGRQLNEAETLDDAESRAEVFREELARRFEGEGVAAGLSGLDEDISGSIDEIVMHADGIVITTAIRCANLATQEARAERARRRAQERRVRLGSKEMSAI